MSLKNTSSSDRPKKRLLVFAGAGASCAVSAEKYPTTAEFFRRLPPELAQDGLLQHIAKNTPKKFGVDQVDVEMVLWCIQELEDFFRSVSKSSNPINWFIKGSKFSELFNATVNLGQTLVAFPGAAEKCRQLREKINELVYSFYSEYPEQGELQDNWMLLFQKALGGGYWLDVFTTNYDLVIEKASELTGIDISEGEVGRSVRRLDIDLWKKAISCPEKLPHPRGLLTKLHGSVHWESERGQVVMGGTAFKGDHGRHALIAPGFKGLPRTQPFATLHDYFERAITRADAIVFIGFAFRDEHINNVISTAAKGKTFISINPSDINAPSDFRGQLVSVEKGFGKDSVLELFDRLA